MISAQNLADRYGVKKSTILTFVKNYLDVINRDGQNAYQTGTKKEWEFTEEAVRIIDKLRDVSSSVAERPADTERVQQLLIENSNLKTALLMARREVEEQKDKVINLLETAPVKELAAAQSDLAAQEKENESLRQKMAEQELQISLLKAEKEEADRKYQEQIQNLSEQLETAKNKKPFWKFWR
jgi:chromosome segregation ATPase